MWWGDVLKETNILEEMLKHKIIAIVRGVKSEDILDVAKALKDGGVNFMEVTFDASSKDGSVDTLKSIALVKNAFAENFYIGAGTVLSTQQVEAAVKAGAEFMISPSMNRAVISRTKELGKISMPGAYTPTEIQDAYEAGADIVKVFPSTCLGVEYFRAIKAPLSHIRLAAVGGVNPENISDFIAAGVDGFGIGSNLVNNKVVAAKNWQTITESAKRFIAAMNQ